MTTTEQILAPKTILKAVSQLELPGTALQRLFGWGFNGRNKIRQSGRHFSFDVFDTTRQVATARGAGQESGRQPPQSVKAIDGTFPRSAETIAMLDEDLLNRHPVGRSNASLDEAGESYITRQEIYLAQRFANLIEMQTAALLRGRYSYASDGDDLRHGFTGGGTTVGFQLPEGNLGALDMLGDGDLITASWSNTGTDIPLQLQNINAAMVQLTGMGLAHVLLTGTGWQAVINNTKV